MKQYMPEDEHKTLVNRSVVLLIYTSGIDQREGNKNAVEIRLKMICMMYEVITVEIPKHTVGINGEIENRMIEIEK